MTQPNLTRLTQARLPGAIPQIPINRDKGVQIRFLPHSTQKRQVTRNKTAFERTSLTQGLAGLSVGSHIAYN